MCAACADSVFGGEAFERDGVMVAEQFSDGTSESAVQSVFFYGKDAAGRVHR